MRGTPHLVFAAAALSGIIPAYAGNTGFRALPRLRCGDHPRVCGEHLFDGERACCGMGSSPRMRGTPRHNDCPHHPTGIIPAYAGNTASARCASIARRDHPRVCGEHTVVVDFVGGLPGSSPRMRGTLYQQHHNQRIAGIIPAYAGNTHVRHWRCRRQGDHPRVCGEHQGILGR